MDNNNWKNLIQNRADLQAHLELEKVLTDRQGGRVMVCFLSDKWMEDADYVFLKQSFCGCFPQCKLSLRVAHPALKDDFLANPEAYWPKLAAILCRDSPALKAVLAKLRLNLDNNVLTLLCEGPVQEELLKRQNVCSRLETALRNIFRLDLHVQIGTLEAKKLAQIALADRERREEEARRGILLGLPSEEAAKIPTAPPVKKTITGDLLYGKTFTEEAVRMEEIRDDSGTVCVEGSIVSADIRELKGGKTKLISFLLTDQTNTFKCKIFLRIKGNDERMEAIEGYCKKGNAVRLRADAQYDEFDRAVVLMVRDMIKATLPKRLDPCAEKRVELHAHTQMSAMDATVSASDLIKQAAEWGHKAIGITDHGVVQSFPEAFAAAKKNKIRFLPGCEIYLLDDIQQFIRNPGSFTLESPYVAFDLETTGFSPRNDGITEIAAIRWENGQVTGQYHRMVNPGKPIPAKVRELTGITDQMVAKEPKIDEVLPDFLEFCEGAVMVAHNAPFDMSFVEANMERMGLSQRFCVLDTLQLARYLYPDQKSFKLEKIAAHVGFTLEGAHRAENDTEALLALLKDGLRLLEERGARTLREVNEMLSGTGSKTYHAVVYAKNQSGLRNLYELVSLAHVEHFGGTRQHPVPRVPRSELIRLREGLILGSACEAGELFRAVLAGEKEDELERIAKFYDYLEVQPIGNNAFLIRNGDARDEEDLRNLNRKIVELGEKMGKPVVATCDVHFLHPQDEVYRRILMKGKGFKDADDQAPLYLHTTEEMLYEFSYLGGEKAREIVIDTPNAIAESFEEITLFPEHPEGKETFQPLWPDAAEKLEKMVHGRIFEMYGDDLPEVVTARVDKELKSIVGNGFSTLYMIAHLLVKKSVGDGYIVGSRGSVGSSLVATCMDITEVNPLPPHYRCTCKYFTFDVDAEKFKVGADLPHKECPNCGQPLIRDGYDIPFEVFLGFFGDKVPDIDLNFSGEYQSKAHAYVEELFGEGHTFRAGTIGTLAEKTAYGFVMKYFEEKGQPINRAEAERLIVGCTGVKRTTGQHPGGIVVLPEEYEVYQFTPIQRPADDMTSSTLTTHFDFNSMHDKLLKLDILGHDDPSMIHTLEALTGKSVFTDVDVSDPKILGLFRSPEPLGLTAEELGVTTGTLGVPEFGTKFVRGMLDETQPTTISELVRISGLSHGTDVWLGNAQELVRSGTATLNECICTRDDIMNTLMAHDVPPKMAFDTMEAVRKGKGLTEAMETAMMEHDVPDWVIESCKKIKYMFPKAHAVAYVTMSLRVAWFKVYHPLAYYAAYFSVRADDFDAGLLLREPSELAASIKELEAQGKEMKAKDGRLLVLLEIVREMRLRGLDFAPIDLYTSDPVKFKVLEDGRLLPSLNSIEGLGDNVAFAIAEARSQPFLSWEDLGKRGRVNKSILETMGQMGILQGIPKSDQLSLFDNL